MATEGQIARGPNGERAVFTNGQWVIMPAQSGQAVMLPAAPDKPAAPPSRTAAGASTEGLPEGYTWRNPGNPAEGVMPIPGFVPTEGKKTSAQQGEERDRVSRLNQLVQQINRVEQLYRAGPGATSGPVESLADYFPTDANAKLDVAGAQLSQQGLAAFRVPGTGTVSDRDAVMFDRGNLPTAATRDVANEEIIRGLKARVEEELQSLGRPAPQWGAAPANRDDQAAPGNALDMIRLQGGNGGGGAAPLADASSEQYQTVANPALERAHNDLVANLIQQGGGRLDPQAYAQGFAQLAQEFGVNDRDTAGRAEWAQAMNAYLDSGGRTLPTTLSTQEVMSAGEIARNNLANNPVGGALAGLGNAATFGGIEAALPGQFAAMQDAQGLPVFAGEVGGAIGTTAALGGLGRLAAGRVARGQFMRNVGADATYGAGFGGVTEGDPLTGGVLGAAGSVAGQGAARGLGALVGGAQRTAAAQALRDRGVPVSVARQLGLGRVEDVMQSLPVAGDVARARQADSFVGFNQAAFQEAGRPIGASIPPIAGRDGIDALDQAVGGAYDSATRGVTVGVDPQFTTDFAALARQIGGLPGDYQTAAQQVVRNRVAPAVAGGQMTGEGYQQAIRGIRAARSNADNVGNTGFEQDYRDALGSAENMLTGAMGRGGGQNTIDGLARANEAYGNLKILEDAALNRAKVGTRTGEVNVFAPSQILEAARRSEARFGNGAALRQLGEEGQAVLPTTLPNSGTADRMIALGAIPATAAAIGGGAGFAGAQQDQGAQGAIGGTGMGLGTLAATSGLLALLGTRGGQQALEQILMTRPQAAQRAGQAIRRGRGLFGSAGSGMALQTQ